MSEIAKLATVLNTLPFSTEMHVFQSLFDMLGIEELHDGIKTAMQDAGYDEWIEDVLQEMDER